MEIEEEPPKAFAETAPRKGVEVACDEVTLLFLARFPVLLPEVDFKVETHGAARDAILTG